MYDINLYISRPISHRFFFDFNLKGVNLCGWENGKKENVKIIKEKHTHEKNAYGFLWADRMEK